eukprot:921708_1
MHCDVVIVLALFDLESMIGDILNQFAKVELDRHPKVSKPKIMHRNQNANIQMKWCRTTFRKKQKKLNYQDQYFIRGSETFARQRSQIFKSESVDAIRRILNSSKDLDITVYTAAIQKSGKLNDVSFCKTIMQLIESRDVPPDGPLFSTLFHAFKINFRMDCCDQFLKKMTDQCKVTPNLVIANALLGGCVKTGDVQRAQRYWQDMITEYNLIPNDMTYMIMIQIYGQHGNITKCKHLYAQLLENNVVPTVRTKTAFMHAYIRNNCIEDALQMKHHIEQDECVLDLRGYMPLISFYMKDTTHFDPKETLRLIDECKSRNKMAQLDDIMMNLKFAANLKLLMNATDQHRKDQLFKKIVVTLPQQRKLNGLSEWNGSCAKSVLQAYLVYYNYEYDNADIMRQFKTFCEELHVLGYWFNCEYSNQWILDLHGYNYDEVKFVLYYILNQRLDELIQAMGYKWVIVCGKGLMTSPISKESQLGIKQFIMNELKLYGISSSVHKRNSGRIILKEQDVKRFVNQRVANHEQRI